MLLALFSCLLPELSIRIFHQVKYLFSHFFVLCSVSKGNIKALKAFINPFEAPQKSVTIKI